MIVEQYVKEFMLGARGWLDRLLQHPFNNELAAGKLSHEVFRRYLGQDSYYLEKYSRALMMMASRAGNAKELLFWMEMAREGVETELALHRNLMQEFDAQKAETALPGCGAYADHIMSVAAYKSYPEAVAALLPCFTNYLEQGQMIAQKAHKDNPYRQWIDTYNDPGYMKTTQKLIDITEQLAITANPATRQNMKEMFRLSSALELTFIDAVYYNKCWEQV